MSTRNLFNLDHGSAGKGDCPRTKFDARWSWRFGFIKWPTTRDSAFVQKNGKLVKVYTQVPNAP